MGRRHCSVHLVLAVLLCLGLFFVMMGTASAHAKVLRAIPAIGSTITSAPTMVTVFTAENMNPDPKKSNYFVYGPAGELISQGNASVSLSNPQQMSVPIKLDGTRRPADETHPITDGSRSAGMNSQGTLTPAAQPPQQARHKRAAPSHATAS